ncbi:hypothetical protein FDECE_18213, partial [Fusarium decemcellulare]
TRLRSGVFWKSSSCGYRDFSQKRCNLNSVEAMSWQRQTRSQLADLDKGRQLNLIRKLWPQIPAQHAGNFPADDYLRFFKYVDHELGRLRLFPGTPSFESSQIFELANNLMRDRSCAMSQLTRGVSNPSVQPPWTRESLQVVATLWLTVKIRTSQSTEPQSSSSSAVLWNDNESLQDAVTRHFPDTSAENYHIKEQRNRIPRGLTIAYLCKRYGFTVFWTDNLADHLQVNWIRNEICVYQHLVCVWNHLKYSDGCPIPQAILKELIDTINLLFPSDLDETKRFLRKQDRGFWEMGYCERPRTLKLEDFKFWRKSVEDLMAILEEPAVGRRQLMLDKEHRNFTDTTTFWVAVGVAVLTVLSSVFGVFSAVYAVRAYNVGVAQLDLAVAQACASNATAFPQFCPQGKR